LIAAALVSGCIPGVNGSTATVTEQPPPPDQGPVPPGVRTPFGLQPSFEDAHSALQAIPAISGGTLRVLADGRTAVASDPDRDQIYVVDYRKETLVATLPLQPGDEPGRVEQDAAGRVHVVLRRGGALVTLDPTAGTITGRRAVCATPRGVAYDAKQDLLHVACADGTLVSLAPAPDGAITRRLTLDSDLRDVVVDGDTLLVSRFRSAQVLSVNQQGVITQRTTPPSSNAIFKTMSGPPMVKMEPSVAWRLVQLSPGNTLMVHQRASTGVVDTQPGGYEGGGCSSIVQSAVSNVGPLGSPVPSAAVSQAVLPVDLAVSPDRKQAALISAGNARQSRQGPSEGQVVMMDMTNVMNPVDNGGCGGTTVSGPPTMTTMMTPPPARQPGDVLSDTVSFITQPTGEAVAVAYDPTGHLLVQTREPATIQIVTSGDAPILLSRDSRLDTGHGIFHANAGGGIACASCHPEGGDDGRVWQFVDSTNPSVPQARRTQNLRGGVTTTAPFHWNGDLPDMSHLMNVVFVSRMGGPQLDADHIDVLGKWLDRVPSLPHDAPADPDAVERGRTVFNQTSSSACVSCHTGGAFTNNTTVDVGTGRAFQVPTLRGLSYRAPYMHNGCAQTLADRFTATCGGGDKHGATSKLTQPQISDLVAYLNSL
jgi:mono/diheme cytochrome c family protein